MRPRSDSPASVRPSLAAPGRDILTLEPGGHYDYASGSSLATAHDPAYGVLFDRIYGLLRDEVLRAMTSEAGGA